MYVKKKNVKKKIHSIKENVKKKNTKRGMSYINVNFIYILI